jgi:signal transduction histidine kinase
MTFLLAILFTLTNLTGVVTFNREKDDYFFVQDEFDTPWRIAKLSGKSESGFSVGDKVHALGTREPSSKHRLETTELTKLGRSEVPIAQHINLEELFARILPFGNAKWYGRVISTEGMLIDINRRQNSTQLLVGENNCNFQVEIPCALNDHLPKDMLLGARLRVTGVLVYTSIEDMERNMARRIENIEIMPQSLSDVSVIKLTPFWTLPKISIAFGSILFVSAALSLFLYVRRRWDNIVADTQRRERLRLAADLHDGFQQYLAGAMFRLQAAINLLPKDATKSLKQLEDAKDALHHTQNGLRATLWAMTEESEGPQSLMALIKFAANRMPHWQGVVTVSSEGKERTMARKIALSILLIIQEAVGNALKHGKAENIAVKISFLNENSLTLTITDDGTGFDFTSTKQSQGHFGLSSMRKRISELGGQMQVDSSLTGTTLTFTI